MITILCVEDEDDIRGLLIEEIRDSGFNTLEAANGRQALDIIISKWPDIVVCDITMPELDGHQLFAEIQMHHEELSNIRFIFLTALSDKENMITALKAGAADYLTKPVDFDLLMAKIQGCVSRLESDRRTGRGF
ncbi:response regulator [Pararhizobium antarcticum]|uniref:Two-component system response regulator n=1 Tax=Pararhizobium antarcticum TaxID=1798805 RepID=A0A657LKM4_9HYPH|nr:response regulator [Pararhizobium antarcticum]OJF90546.1 two-component system response regulator [Pararhizobium antarcticum]